MIAERVLREEIKDGVGNTGRVMIGVMAAEEYERDLGIYVPGL
jgi:hypothetical protein